jgi:ABC-type Fe3+-siderophore transport system permease subunit
MDSDTPFNLMLFTDSTKKVCMCSASSIFIIVLFIISPLSNFLMTSMFMKVIALILLVYTIYLNNNQTNSLRNASQVVKTEQLKSQINMNIMCSYVFTAFIGLLIIFVIKSFF